MGQTIGSERPLLRACLSSGVEGKLRPSTEDLIGYRRNRAAQPTGLLEAVGGQREEGGVVWQQQGSAIWGLWQQVWCVAPPAQVHRQMDWLTRVVE
jgi:hypothetical protein